MSPTTESNSIVGRIVRAASAQTVNQLARVVQLFVLVPICLNAWGTAIYEDWLLLSSIAAFFALADLGFVQLITVKLIGLWSRGDAEGFASEWSRVLGLSLVFVVVLGTVLCLFWVLPGWTSVIPTHRLSGAELAATIVLLSLAQLAWILLGVAFAAYRSRGDLSRGYHASSILVVLQATGMGAPAALGSGPIISALGNCSVTIAMLGLVVVDLLRRYPDMPWKPTFPSFAKLRMDARSAVGYLVSPVTTSLMLNGPTVLLALLSAPQGSIVLFNTSRTIAGVARQLPYQFAHPAGVELASLLARGERNRLARLFASASQGLAMVVGGVSGFVVAAAPLVLTLWTDGKVGYDPVLMILLLGTTAICAPSQVAYTMLWYGGYPGLLNRALVFSAALGIGLALLFGTWLDVRGIALGLGIGEIVGVGFYLPALADRLLMRPRGTEFLQNLRVTLLSLSISAGLGYLMLRIIGPHNWQGLIELGIAWAIPAAAAHYWLVISASQRGRVASSVASYVRSRRAKPPMV
jgi:O-antigen/teichoic acid export membrane protein